MISAALATDLTLMLLAANIKKPFQGVVEDKRVLGIFQLDWRRIEQCPDVPSGRCPGCIGQYCRVVIVAAT